LLAPEGSPYAVPPPSSRPAPPQKQERPKPEEGKHEEENCPHELSSKARPEIPKMEKKPKSEEKTSATSSTPPASKQGEYKRQDNSYNSPPYSQSYPQMTKSDDMSFSLPSPPPPLASLPPPQEKFRPAMKTKPERMPKVDVKSQLPKPPSLENGKSDKQKLKAPTIKVIPSHDWDFSNTET